MNNQSFPKSRRLVLHRAYEQPILPKIKEISPSSRLWAKTPCFMVNNGTWIHQDVSPHFKRNWVPLFVPKHGFQELNRIWVPLFDQICHKSDAKEKITEQKRVTSSKPHVLWWIAERGFIKTQVHISNGPQFRYLIKYVKKLMQKRK